MKGAEGEREGETVGGKGRSAASKARERDRHYLALRQVSAMFAAGVAAVVLILLGLNAWGRLARAARFTPVQAEGDAVRLPLAQVSEGQARFYTYQGSRPIRFFVLRSSDGVARAAFDACDLCFKERKGYQQEAEVMVCRECGEKFPLPLVGERRGECNPAPLEGTVHGGLLILRTSDLEAGAKYF